jgi:hypothetical protein
VKRLQALSKDQTGYDSGRPSSTYDEWVILQEFLRSVHK